MEIKPYSLIADQFKKDKPVFPLHKEAGNNLVELKPELDKLSQDQEAALLKVLFSDANVVVISGNAGTGKTTVQHLASDILSTIFNCEVVKTAAFGIAALNMGGATLASTFGLRINHVLPWFDDGSVMNYRVDEKDYANGMGEKDQSTRVSINGIYGQFNKYRKLKFSRPIFWFVDEFSTITSEQFLACYQLLRRLNPNKSIKVVCFGQPIQMLSPSIGTDEFGLNFHSRAWETAKYNLKGYYTSEERYPADLDNPIVYADERKSPINYTKEMNHTEGGELDRVIIFNSTKQVEYGSLLVAGQGPYIKYDPSWRVIYHCLTKNHRQGDSLAFANICTAIAERKPIEDNEFWRPLLNRITSKVNKKEVEKAVWLVRTHKRKDNINNGYLSLAKRRHSTEVITYRSEINLEGRTLLIDSVDTSKQIIHYWNPEREVVSPYPYGHLTYSNHITNFFKCLSIPVKQELVPSLPVISRLNVTDLNIANGTVGYLYRTEDNSIWVERTDTGEEQEWKYVVPSLVPRNHDGYPWFGYKTLPCHQANALTFQSCQGLTITGKGVIDVDMEMLKGKDGFNSAGAMYVNLTRFTDLENVIIQVPNDAYTNAHLLNEVIFMDDSSVEFMEFIKKATPYEHKRMVFDNGAGKTTVDVKEEEKPIEPEVEVYFDCEYKNDTIFFNLEGKRSCMSNLPDFEEVCGLNVMFKQNEDDYYDVLIWFFKDECKDKTEAVYHIDRNGLINYLKTKGIDHQYIMVMVGEADEDSIEESVDNEGIDEVIKVEETVEENSVEEPTELELLRKENEELKAKLADSVSRAEFNELKDQLAQVVAMLNSKK